MSKRRKQARRSQNAKRNTSTLAQHRRQRKQLSPPLMSAAGDKLRAVPWIPDSLPDMLWLCAQMSLDSTHKGLLLCSKALDLMQEVIDEAIQEDDGDLDPKRPIATGTLTSFEGIPEELRPTILSKLQAQGGYEWTVPEDFANALAMYPSAPGSWLLEPWRMASNRIDPEGAQRFLAKVINDSRHGQDPVPTRAKAIVFRQFVTSGKLRFVGDVGKDVREALPRWPDKVTEQERLRIESFIRASWGSLNALWDEDDSGADSPGTAWAKEFWRANWRLFVCVLPEPLSRGDDAKVHEAREAYTRDVETIYHLFLHVTGRLIQISTTPTVLKC